MAKSARMSNRTWFISHYWKLISLIHDSSSDAHCADTVNCLMADTYAPSRIVLHLLTAYIAWLFLVLPFENVLIYVRSGPRIANLSREQARVNSTCLNINKVPLLRWLASLGDGFCRMHCWKPLCTLRIYFRSTTSQSARIMFIFALVGVYSKIVYDFPVLNSAHILFACSVCKVSNTHNIILILHGLHNSYAQINHLKKPFFWFWL